MIKAVVIPPAMEQPLRCAEIDPRDLSIYEGVTGGNLQTHELRNPAMTLYSNSVLELKRSSRHGLTWGEGS